MIFSILWSILATYSLWGLKTHLKHEIAKPWIFPNVKKNSKYGNTDIMQQKSVPPISTLLLFLRRLSSIAVYDQCLHFEYLTVLARFRDAEKYKSLNYCAQKYFEWFENGSIDIF